MINQEKSNQIKEALRDGFKDGSSKMANRKCFGYDRTADGTLIINSQEAKIIQLICDSYLERSSLGKISDELERRSIPSPTGRGKWNREAISKILSNEKYVGSVLLQKTISSCGYQVKNQGDADKVLIKGHHPAIISKELFEAVQEAKFERSKGTTEEMGMKMMF
jgi:Recombinase.